jgi:hypothetical protein
MVAYPRPVDWAPADNNMVAVNFNLPAVQFNNTALTAGTLYLAKVTMRQPGTLTDMWLVQGNTGNGASTGTFVGVYSNAGKLLTGSADQAANFTSFGNPLPLTTPHVAANGEILWAAVLVNLAVTQPKLEGGYGGSGNIGNLNLPAAAYNFADNGTGLTALPASITLANNDSGNSYPFWVGFS